MLGLARHVVDLLRHIVLPSACGACYVHQLLEFTGHLSDGIRHGGYISDHLLN